MHAQLKAYPKSVYVLYAACLGCSFTCLTGGPSDTSASKVQ